MIFRNRILQNKISIVVIFYETYLLFNTFILCIHSTKIVYIIKICNACFYYFKAYFKNYFQYICIYTTHTLIIETERLLMKKD